MQVKNGGTCNRNEHPLFNDKSDKLARHYKWFGGQATSFLAN